MRANKISPAEKLQTVQLIEDGRETQNHAADRLGVRISTVQQWISVYKSDGEGAFLITENKQYSRELKERAVLDYLSGKGSQQEICQRYGIRARSKLHNWIMMYNGHRELKATRAGGTPIMTKGRKTSFDERVEIVQYCISHDHNYKKTSEKYGVSYQQARSYTVKYEAGGVDALKDRRGRTKPEEEMTELERLRAENRLLKAQKRQAEMEVSFLKKLSEIERRWG